MKTKKRPIASDYLKVGDDYATDDVHQWVLAQEDFIDYQASEIKSLKEQLEKKDVLSFELKRQLLKVEDSYKQQLEKEMEFKLRVQEELIDDYSRCRHRKATIMKLTQNQE